MHLEVPRNTAYPVCYATVTAVIVLCATRPQCLFAPGVTIRQPVLITSPRPKAGLVPPLPWRADLASSPESTEGCLPRVFQACSLPLDMKKHEKGNGDSGCSVHPNHPLGLKIGALLGIPFKRRGTWAVLEPTTYDVAVYCATTRPFYRRYNCIRYSRTLTGFHGYPTYAMPNSVPCSLPHYWPLYWAPRPPPLHASTHA